MANTYVKIASVSLSSAAASIEFTSLPATYTDLCIKYSLRSARVDTDDTVNVDFNAYAGTNLSMKRLEGNGASASSVSTSTIAFRIDAANNTASTFTSVEIYIPNYANSSYNKSLSIDYCFEQNGTTAYSGLVAGLWSSTAAITSIKITSGNSANFDTYSTATLYGIINS
jgi:hypothetical protein